METDESHQVADNFKKLLGYFESRQNDQDSDPATNNLPVRLGDRIQLLAFHDIQYLIASSGYIEIYTSGKRHLLRDSFINLIPKLAANSFLRIHRSTCINIHYLKELKHLPFGLLEVRMKDGKVLKVSKSFKAGLLARIGL